MQTSKPTQASFGKETVRTHLWVPSSTGNTGTSGRERWRRWGRRGRGAGGQTGTLRRGNREGQVICHRRWGREGRRGRVGGRGCDLAFGGRGWQIIIQWRRRRRGWEV